MTRRELMALLGGAVAWPLAARAQQAPMPVVGFLNSTSLDGYRPMLNAFRQGLQESGYIEGRNVAIEYRWSEGQNDRLSAMAAELVRRQVTVIAAMNTASVLAAREATTTIPVVFYTGTDPVQLGLVTSLSRPGGNLTGVVTLNVELVAKRLELLHELVPAASVIAVLVNPTDSNVETTLRSLRAAARDLRLQLHVLRASTEREIDDAFAVLSQLKAGGVVIGPDVFFNTRSEQLGALASRHGVAAIYQNRAFALAGGLMSYSSDIAQSHRLAGGYTGQILKGEKPADLPVQQATKVRVYHQSEDCQGARPHHSAAADRPRRRGDRMKLPRRKFLHLAAGAAALPTLPRVARAQAYPTRPVHLIVGAPPGGVADIHARLIGQWLSERLGQPFIIENRPGAGTNIATEMVTHAPADGHTLLLVSINNAINATLYNKLAFNFIRDIVPVAGLIRSPNVMEVNPAVPVKTVPEFIAYAKANPGKLNMASPGNGSVAHIAGEMFKRMAGIEMTHVPYRGAAPAVTDLIGGQVQVAFDPMSSSIAHIKAGKLRALAVTTSNRSDALPDIPTVGDFLPGFEASGWFGIGAPKGTPAEIVDKLNREINAGLADTKIKARIADLGNTVLAGSPADFGGLIADETEKWGKVIRAANIKPD